MERVFLSLTVYFDDPFWVGVFERQIDNQLSVYKVTFGQEPKEEILIEWINTKYLNLKMSSQVVATKQHRHVNPKRKQREVKKQILSQGVGTKAQQALKESYELSKKMKKATHKQESLKQKQAHFELKQQKKKEKHKGH